MQIPSHASATRRRNLLASATAMIAAPATLAATPNIHPDEGLIAACQQVESLVRAMDAMVEEDDVEFDTPRGDEFVKLNERQSDLIRHLLHMQARTIDGIAARARVLAVYNGHGAFSMDPTTETNAGCLVIGLMRDVLLMNGEPLPAVLAREFTI